MSETEEKPKLSKAELNVQMTKERRARKQATSKKRPVDVERSRTKEVQIITSRKDPELRKKQLKDKEDAEKERVAKIKKQKLANQKKQTNKNKNK